VKTRLEPEAMTERLTKVEFSNLDKVLYPELRITKAQVIEYYIKVAPKMLNLLAGRPIVMTRFPNGIDREGFYEKDAPQGTPLWVKTFRRYSETAEREINYVLCDDLDTLLWLANLASLEIHMTLSKADSFENPDLIVFDLDPKPPAGYDDVAEVALLVKERLDSLRLRSYVKTSGKKGLHIIIPIVDGYNFQQARDFVQKVAAYVGKQTEKVVAERSKSNTPGRVYIDYVQNSHGRTMICPYSTRATPQATVSMPLEWSDVEKGLNPEEFNLFSAVKVSKSPWKGLLENRQKLEANS
jgi:bifunctional non-homologous end joining protein LigD